MPAVSPAVLTPLTQSKPAWMTNSSSLMIWAIFMWLLVPKSFGSKKRSG
jgi:hypothetical protein